MAYAGPDEPEGQGAAQGTADDDGVVAAKPKPKAKKLKGGLFEHAARLAMYKAHQEQQRPNRQEAALDRDYYDGNQLTAKERETLKKRGQPLTIHNLLAKKLNTLLGEEIEKRTDPVTKPRTPKGETDARAATALLRYVADEQKFSSVRSRVAESCWKEGIGAALKTFENGKSVLRHIEYDRFGYDIHNRDPLFEKCAKWVDVWMDEARARELFPDGEKLFDDVSQSFDDISNDTPRDWFTTGNEGRRFKIVEMYFEVGGDCYCAYFTERGDLQPVQPSWLMDEKREHSVCPLEAVSCYIDRNGNRYGILRNLRSIQDAINKRESKSLHLLNAEQVIAEKNVIPQPDLFMAELAKPNGFAEVAEGSLIDPTTGRERIQIRRHLDLAQGHVQLLQEAKASLDRSGPSASNLPELSTGASGRALIARRKAAALDYGTIFDNLRSWTRNIVFLDWLTVRQEYTEELVFRVTDETDGFRFIGINQTMTRAQRFQELLQQKPPVPPQKALETATDVSVAPAILSDAMQQIQAMAQQAQAMGQQVQPQQLLVQAVMRHPLMQLSVTANRVALMDMDIVIDEAPDTAVIAEEQFQTLSELAGPLLQAKPDIAPQFVKMLVQASTLPDKRELIDALEKGPGPEEQKAKAEAQKLQQQVAMLTVQLQAAQVQKTQADAHLADAKAKTEMAQLSLPLQGQQQTPPDPLQHARAQREQVNTQLDVVKTQAHVQRDQAMTRKHEVDTAAVAKKMMQPDAAIVEVA